MHQHAQPEEPRRGRKGPWLLAVFLVVLVVLALRSVVLVDQTEVVYITEFGRPVRLVEKPGLHFLWPYQSCRSFDKRLQLHAPPAREMLTKDKKNLEVAWYLAWRIKDVDRFLRSVRTVPDASARLEDLAASILAAELGGKDLTELVKVGETSALGPLMDDVTRRTADQAGSEYGIEVVDCRLRRLNYPEEVRSAVFEQIRSERRRVAASTRAEGESQARIIRSAADLERARTLADAEADATRTVGEGEAEATRVANAAHARNPAFYEFLKTLETYRSALDRRTTLVLSAESPFLRLLTQGLPQSERGQASPAATAATGGNP
ncbi:MAG TPA: protease modulator HflC [Isosphaeraceae bacterium]|nr:protease modulator HflC [Isosphaeraceae bacterium]